MSVVEEAVVVIVLVSSSLLVLLFLLLSLQVYTAGKIEDNCVEHSVSETTTVMIW